jgi:hypothetical protein
VYFIEKGQELLAGSAITLSQAMKNLALFIGPAEILASVLMARADIIISV